MVIRLLGESIYAPTEEVYGSASGFLEWKEAQILFRSHPRLPSRVAAAPAASSRNTILALMDDRLEVEAGGTLLGLVKHPNPPRQQGYYRPTWLEQFEFPDGSKVTSFSINSESLTLSNQSLLKPSTSSRSGSSSGRIGRMRLVDLRPLGDFIEHYCVAVKELILDGRTISSCRQRPIVAVLDTGLTGCLVTQSFWDALTEDEDLDPRRVKALTVRVPSTTTPPDVVDLTSGRGFNKLFYLAPIVLDWFVDEPTSPHVIVLGQTFFSQGTLTIDVEDRLASFEL